MAEQNEPAAGRGAAAPASGLAIVGIGASAGGLTALRAILARLPPEPGVAIVVVMHLAPDRESHLVELLAPSSPLPVEQVTRTVALEPNRVFVIPPNANLNSIDTHLRLSDLEVRRADRAPIDHFFRTLAETHGGNAMGVVLTGGGTDGTLGLRYIREQGGLTVAQDPEEAEYPSMPHSAADSGMVDRVLPLAAIADELVHFARARPLVELAEDTHKLAVQERDALAALFAEVRRRTGQDLLQYRDATILRRLHRRMQLQHVETVADYVELVRRREGEAAELFEDLLITVTEFFRDPEIYAALAREVIPRLVAGKANPGDQVRVWSVGCATGEEAYSLAMLLVEEAAAQRDGQDQIQVLASDLHAAALKKAREGLYPEQIARDVSAERLARFFEHGGGRYRIGKEIRDLVVFASHNLLRDPPFSRIDLVVCRNLLIYLKREVQRRVFELFHYALEPGGLLLLGTSESLGRGDLFEPVPGISDLFRKRPVAGPKPGLHTLFAGRGLHGAGALAATAAGGLTAGVAHARMVERFAPPSVLVGADNEVVHYSAHAGRYLRVPGGAPTHNVCHLVSAPLGHELGRVLRAARQRGRPVRSRPLTVQAEGTAWQVVMSVHPAEDRELRGFLLVIFDELDEGSPPGGEQVAPAADAAGGGARAPDHAAGAFPGIQPSATEADLQASNEELRALIKALESSKEELQSLNEELTTVNDENARRLEELGRLNADLRHFHAATKTPTLFLDRTLSIVRYTPQAEALFRLRTSDSGRPLSDLTNRLAYPDLQADVQAVLAGRERVEREVASDSGCWYLVRILPYRPYGTETEGVVITLIDISARRRAEDALRQSEKRFRALVTASSFAVYRMSPDWGEMRELDGRGFIADTAKPKKDWLDAYIHPDDQPMVLAAIEEAVRHKRMFALEHRVRRVDGTLGWTYSRAVPLLDEAGEITEWFGAASDVTERHKAAEALRAQAGA
jgi:two-component system CheB/CheR fusion protein